MLAWASLQHSDGRSLLCIVEPVQDCVTPIILGLLDRALELLFCTLPPLHAPESWPGVLTIGQLGSKVSSLHLPISLPADNRRIPCHLSARPWHWPRHEPDGRESNHALEARRHDDNIQLGRSAYDRNNDSQTTFPAVPEVALLASAINFYEWHVPGAAPSKVDRSALSKGQATPLTTCSLGGLERNLGPNPYLIRQQMKG